MNNKFEVVKLKSIYEECKVWNSLICVTQWSNHEGFDILLTSKNGGIQHLSITDFELNIVKKAVKAIKRSEDL